MTKGRERFHLDWMLVERTADPSAALRSGRDDKGKVSAFIWIGCWLSEPQARATALTRISGLAPVGGCDFLISLLVCGRKA